MDACRSSSLAGPEGGLGGSFMSEEPWLLSLLLLLLLSSPLSWLLSSLIVAVCCLVAMVWRWWQWWRCPWIQTDPWDTQDLPEKSNFPILLFTTKNACPKWYFALFLHSGMI